MKRHLQPGLIAIYRYICLVTMMEYVGQSEDFDERYKTHFTGKIKIDQAIRQLGIENFRIEIIEYVKSKLATEAEDFWIAELNTLTPFGYNQKTSSKPARGWHQSEEAKQKIYNGNAGINSYLLGKKGKDHPAFGTKRSEEQKEKASVIMKEKYGDGKHPRKGVSQTPEHSQKIRDAQKGIPRPHTSGESHYLFGKSKEEHPCFGREVSVETREKQRQNMAGKYNGEKSVKAKLTNIQAEEIRNDPRSSRKIAKDYGVTKNSVLAIKNGKSYKKQ